MKLVPNKLTALGARLASFTRHWWGRIFPAKLKSIQKNDDAPTSFIQKVTKLAKAYWIVIFFVVLFGVVLGWMAYDGSSSHQTTTLEKSLTEEVNYDLYARGWHDRDDTAQKEPAATVTLALPDGKKIEGSINFPKGATGGIFSGAGLTADSSMPIYKSAKEEMWDTIWSVIRWFGYALLLSVGVNLVARFMIGKGGPGEPKLAIARLFSRASVQASGPGPAGAVGDANDPHGLKDRSFIKIIMPEENKMRLKDLVFDQHVMDEIKPIIEAVKKQIKDRDALLAEALELQKAEAKKRPKGQIAPPAPTIVVPPIRPGLYGFVPGTKILLDGPPGGGKTALALAIAGELGVPFLSLAGTFEDVFIGKGKKNVEILMQVASELGICFIFIDEFEQAGKTRTNNTAGGATGDASVAALLRALDGAETKLGLMNGVHWLAATNHAAMVDPALQREQRLKIIAITMPGLDTLKRLFKLYFGKLKVPLVPEFDPESTIVAQMMLGKSGADVKGLSNQFAGYAEEVAKRHEKRLRAQGNEIAKPLRAQAKALVTEMKESGATDEQIDTALQSAGLAAEQIKVKLEIAGCADEQIEQHLAGLKFGQENFLESVQRLLMGRKKRVGKNETFQLPFGTTVHEGLHALANATMEYLELLDYRVRFLTVAEREKSLGLMYASPDHELLSMSIKNVFAKTVVGFAGAAGQLVAYDDTERWGRHLDLHRDSGALKDNQGVADLIFRSIAQFGGSLRLGPISKGQGGNTWFTEMGPTVVDDVDREVRICQKHGQFISWKLATIFMQSEVVWQLFDRVLNSPDRIVVEGEFYQYFDKIMSDPKVKKEIEALPDLYLKFASNDKKVLVWIPSRQSFFARRFINKQTAWLKERYVEAKRLRDTAEAEVEAEDKRIEESEAETVEETAIQTAA